MWPEHQSDGCPVVWCLRNWQFLAGFPKFKPPTDEDALLVSAAGFETVELLVLAALPDFQPLALKKSWTDLCSVLVLKVSEESLCGLDTVVLDL